MRRQHMKSLVVLLSWKTKANWCPQRPGKYWAESFAPWFRSSTEPTYTSSDRSRGQLGRRQAPRDLTTEGIIDSGRNPSFDCYSRVQPNFSSNIVTAADLPSIAAAMRL